MSSPTTQPYSVTEDRLDGNIPALNRMFSTDHPATTTNTHHPYSPPDLLHDSEDDEDSYLSTPSRPSSPIKEQGIYFSRLSVSDHQRHHGNHSNHNGNNENVLDPTSKSNTTDNTNHHTAGRCRRKSTPYRSPPSTDDDIFSMTDRSIVFQLFPYSFLTMPYLPANSEHHSTSKVISGQLFAQRLISPQPRRLQRYRRSRTLSMIHIPLSLKKRSDDKALSDSESSQINNTHSFIQPNSSTQQQLSELNQEMTDITPDHKKLKLEHNSGDDHPNKGSKKNPSRSTPYGSAPSGRPARVKGPCQACNEASDGCMRKAFNWPFPANQVFKDKGKPFVYLCNKCGLRYNKSGGCVCHHCRWVLCKDEKRKALQLIEAMRRNRPDRYVDPNEEIASLLCNPKYWTCNKPWKVGWVLNRLDEDEDETEYPSFSSPVSNS